MRERERWNSVGGGTKERDGAEDIKCHNTEMERGWGRREESEGSSTHMPAQEKQITTRALI